MSTAARISAVVTAITAVRMLPACTSPMDGEVADVPAELVEASASKSPELAGSECDEVKASDEETSTPPPDERCNFANAWHCRHAHQGWAWRLRYPRHRPGYVSGIEDVPSGSQHMCCVRVGPSQWRPENT